MLDQSVSMKCKFKKQSNQQVNRFHDYNCVNIKLLQFFQIDSIKWYKDGHAPKGWTVFMDQMKKFVEWLEQAESGNTCEKFACSSVI